MLLMIFIGLVPQLIPVFLGIMYSFWLPQIWRNARRGIRKALSWRFVFGMSAARLALPLCEWLGLYKDLMLIWITDAYACPDNVFFNETTSTSASNQFYTSTLTMLGCFRLDLVTCGLCMVSGRRAACTREIWSVVLVSNPRFR